MSFVLTQSVCPHFLSSPGKFHQLLSCVQLFATLWTAATRPPCPSPTPGVYSNLCPTISSSVIHFSSRLQHFPASGSFTVSQFFSSGSQSIGVSASASVLPMNVQDWFPYPTPQFKSINSSALNFVFYSLTLTSIHDYWKNPTFEYTDLCLQSNVSAF